MIEQPTDDTPQTPQSETSYSVGYGKPPQSHQFRKGKSGNPKGRPKRDTNLRDVFRKMLDEDVTGQGGNQVLSGDEAVVRALVQGALSCKPRAFRKFIQLATQANLFKDTAGPRSSVVYIKNYNDEYFQHEIAELRRKLEEFKP